MLLDEANLLSLVGRLEFNEPPKILNMPLDISELVFDTELHLDPQLLGSSIELHMKCNEGFLILGGVRPRGGITFHLSPVFRNKNLRI